MVVGLGLLTQMIWADRDNFDQVPRAASVGDLAPELAGSTLDSDYGRNQGEEREPGQSSDTFSDSSEAEWSRQNQGATVALTYRRYWMSTGRTRLGSGVDRAGRDLEDVRSREPSCSTDVPGLGHEAYEGMGSHPTNSSGSSACMVVRMHNVVIHVRYSWPGTGADEEEAARRVVRGIATAAIERLQAVNR